MAAPQQGNPSDNSAAMLWGVAAFFAAIGGLWYGFKSQIVHAYLTFKLYEVNALAYFADNWGLRPGYFDDLRAKLANAMLDPANVDFMTLLSLGNQVGDLLRFPLIIALFVMAVAVYFGNTARVYRRVYNMRELAKLERTNWPHINPVVDLDLIKTDLDTGPWAMAMNPMQFCKKHNLLIEVRPQRREGMARKDWDRIDVILKRGEANKIFSLQLGQMWRGIDKLPPHARALFAAFAARINADTKSAAELFSQLSLSATSGKLNLKGVDALIKKHGDTKLVQEIVHSHAYVFTVMASMLEGSRADGVQASADFLWLKPLDRRLWYILNTVGRQTPFIEVAGIFAHWIAEKEAGRKLLIPMIEEATIATEIALKEVVYKPEEANQ